MTPIYWTEAARTDLRAVQAYIARDSLVYARRMVNRIKKAVGRLRRFPESGSDNARARSLQVTLKRGDVANDE